MMRCILLLLLLFCSAAAHAETREFSQFSADLPEGWDGEENTGFMPDQRGYMLVLGRKDAEGENFIAQVSIFLLPALPGTPKDIAGQMASMQDNASTPQKEGQFWVFTGEPRAQTFKAPAVTRVNATSARVLVIIAQDPDNLGADKVVSSLQGLTPEAKELVQ